MIGITMSFLHKDRMKVKRISQNEGIVVSYHDEKTNMDKEFILLNLPTNEDESEGASLHAGSDGVTAANDKASKKKNTWYYYDKDLPCPLPMTEARKYLTEQLEYRKELSVSLSTTTGSDVAPDDLTPGCLYSSVKIVGKPVESDELQLSAEEKKVLRWFVENFSAQDTFERRKWKEISELLIKLTGIPDEETLRRVISLLNIFRLLVSREYSTTPVATASSGLQIDREIKWYPTKEGVQFIRKNV